MSQTATPVLTLENGYHHFIDTCICGQTGSSRIVIDGAIVRLIRLGTPFLSEKKTILTDAVITVNRGELRHLNASYVLDEFTGGLTVIFNNNTYRAFLADYSTGKIHPQKGRWMVDSGEGGCLAAGSETGEFLVMGGVVAYAVSADGTRAYYSVGGVLRLPQGLSRVEYAPRFSTALLPPPPDGLCWVNNGLGEVTACAAVREVFVSERGSDDGDGSAQHPLRSVGTAAALLGDEGGIVHLSGTLSFTAPPPHSKPITYLGEGKSTRLMFDRPHYYYLSGDSTFDNMYLIMHAESTALVSGGHRLRYGPSIWTTVNMYSVLSNPLTADDAAIAFGEPTLLGTGDTCSATVSKKQALIYCFEGEATVHVGKTMQTISAGGALFLQSPGNLTIQNNKNTRLLMCTFVSRRATVYPRRVKLIRAAAATLFGDILEQVWRNPALIRTEEVSNTLSQAVHTALGIDDSRAKIHHQLKLFLESHFAEVSSVEDVAHRFHMNRSYLEREFKKVYGIGIKQELTRRKMEAARNLLSKGFSVTQTAKTVGYDSVSTFSRAFRTFTGFPPSVYYRKQ